ncbi:MAG: DUF3576 domain-containing protein [Magnetococcus sp. DMHC-6]
MKTKQISISILALSSLVLMSCSSHVWNSRNKTDESALAKFGQKKVLDEAKEKGDYDAASQEPGNSSLFSFGKSSEKSASMEEIRANKLYAGALDVVMELPIQVANRAGGLIATDWKIDPQDATQRYRLNIRVSGQEPYGEVKVVVLKQQLVKDVWSDAPSDPDLAKQIEKAIRKQADIVRQ